LTKPERLFTPLPEEEAVSLGRGLRGSIGAPNKNSAPPGGGLNAGAARFAGEL
jgi:hypothetical protein